MGTRTERLPPGATTQFVWREVKRCLTSYRRARKARDRSALPFRREEHFPACCMRPESVGLTSDHSAGSWLCESNWPLAVARSEANVAFPLAQAGEASKAPPQRGQKLNSQHQVRLVAQRHTTAAAIKRTFVALDELDLQV